MASRKKKARPQNIPARVAEGIRDLITRGTLGPGVHLGQAELAKRFSASRVPIREALKLLVSEGLIQHDVNRGFFVASISLDDAVQLYCVRHLLEHELLSTVAWPSEAELTQLRSRVQDLERVIAEGKRSEWAHRHRDFHRAIFELSDQKILVREVLRLWTRTDRYRSLLPPQTPAEGVKSGERALVEALAKRDRKGLLKIFEKDRLHVEQMLVSTLRAREG
jgi:DNA-binding GntR family transcriptional regulator